MNIEDIEQNIMRVQDQLANCYRPARDWPQRIACIKVGYRQEVSNLREHLNHLRLQLQHAHGQLSAHRQLANPGRPAVT